MIERLRPWRCSAHRLATFAVLALACASGPSLAQQPATSKTAGKAEQPPAAANPPAPPGPVGIWIDHTGRGAIAIETCSTGQVGLCGRIVWMQQPLDKAGQPLRDKLNEDRRLRDRPICGLQVIGDLKPMRDGSWDRGWIYDPEQGESFDVELRLREPNVLQVKGYKGLKFLSETFQWRRAEAPPTPACPPAAGPA
jgi:uncharacterized protein (DUF2147 family)